MGDIEFVVRLPQWSEQTTPSGIERVATAAERLGFAGVRRGDHIAFPAGIADMSSWDAQTPAYDVFALLAAVAGTTNDIRIGVDVCIAPYRHPVYLAKLALTLDALSAGRFDFGVAPGWLRPEFDVLDIPFEERGRRTDEFLSLFEQVQREAIVEFSGEFHTIDSTGFYPRPVQEPIPIWIGGATGASFRRVAQFGDGWSKSMTPEALEAYRPRLLAAWEDFDREGSPEIAASQQLRVGTDHELDADRPLVGEPASIAADIGAYIDAGATRLDLRQESLPIDERIRQLERFQEEVLPAL